MSLSGHRLATRQLADLQRFTQGAVQVLVEPEDDDEPFLVSLDTHGIPRGPGVRVGGREMFKIFVPPTFPYRPPTVLAAHRRWRGSPHVQWGRQLCLYAAASVEWDPGEGMRGFVVRLLAWVERAAAGELDPDGQPLHPPVAYTGRHAGQLVVHPDLGDRVPWSKQESDMATDRGRTAAVTLFAWCVRDGDRVEVLEWLTVSEVLDRVLSTGTPLVDDRGRRGFVAPTLLLTGELGWEYPDTAWALAAGVTESGCSGDELLLDLVRAATVNQLLRSRSEPDGDTDPVILVIGTPSRRVAGSARLAHLVAWKLDNLGARLTELLRDYEIFSIEALEGELGDLARRWLSIAGVDWMQVHEARPEVTHRRDEGTPASWLYDKRILVLGCGALGAPAAEHCVRAGARHITVLDNGTVTPGILVRQPFAYLDIGRPKADALAERLNTLTRAPSIIARVANAVIELTDPRFDPTAFDLIIDATADVGVRAALERSRYPRRGDWPPLATMLIGHQADRGVVCLSRPGATGAGHDLLRRVAIRAHGAQRSTWGDIADDLFPDPPRSVMFFPEPGCSAPTFVGSAAQVSALAAQMLLRTVDHIAVDSGAPMTAVGVRTGSTATADTAADTATNVLTWGNDLVCDDTGTGFEVRISAAALAEMRAETRRVARTRGCRVETGGLLLGAVDDATGVVHIDVAAGPPPDSRLSTLHFEFGTAGTQELVDHHRKRTAQRTSYVGVWHTHPYGVAKPSATDEAGLAALTTFPGAGPWALMVILAGHDQVWEAWRDGTKNPQIYVQVVRRAADPLTNGAVQHPRPEPPPGTYFPGGYARITQAGPPAARRPWWRRRQATR